MDGGDGAVVVGGVVAEVGVDVVVGEVVGERVSVGGVTADVEDGGIVARGGRERQI